jgi:hypothetical protein
MIEAVSTSEISVKFYQNSQRSVTKDSHLHTRSRGKLKPHPTLFDHFEVIPFCTKVSSNWCLRKSLSQAQRRELIWRNDSFAPFHAVLTLAPAGSDWLALRPCCFVPLYPSGRRLVGPQSQYGRGEEKSLPLPGVEL